MKLFFVSVLLSVMIFSCRSMKMNESDFASVKVSRDFIKRFPDPDTIHWVGQKNHFSWQAGYIMFAMEKMWNITSDSVYFNYIKRYVDQQVDENGNVADFKNNALDNFIPGYAILFMYEQTGKEKYLKAAQAIFKGFEGYPRAGNGLFFHSAEEWSKNQCWIDGVFMGQIFTARYAMVTRDEAAINQVIEQISLAVDVFQKENGLLLHGWNEDKTAKWADKVTGLSPEVWSEGLGWFAVLMADVFDYLPEDHAGRAKLMDALKKLCYGLKNTADSATGMWCQVVDKPYTSGNWNETSGTGMYMYLLQNSIDRGYISEEEFQPVVKKAYGSIVKKAVLNKDSHYDLIDCSSIGVMSSYEEYISQPHEISPFAAFGSFIIGTSAFEKHMDIRN